MVGIYSYCGEWKRNDKSLWEFQPERNRFGSLSEIDDNVTYKDLLEMVIEDLRIDSSVQRGDIRLSYEFPSKLKSMVQESPPVDIRNDRQLRTFINKIKEDNKLIPLCVTVKDKSNVIAVENVIHNGEEDCDVERDRHTNVFQNLDGHSYVDESTSVHEEQQELHRSIGSNNDIYEEGNHPFRFHPILEPCPISVDCSYSTDGLHVNKCFKNKQELMFMMRKWALEWKFEFKSLCSDKSRVVLVCVDDKCSWRMRATKLDFSDIFVVKSYVHEHTCDTAGRSVNHKQATAKLVGTLIRNNNGEPLKPKQIIEQVRKEHGIEITYGKAWRAKEQAQNLMRGTPGSETETLCPPPSVEQTNGRSTKKRMRSSGGSHRCSKCGREGHHKNTCEIPV